MLRMGSFFNSGYNIAWHLRKKIPTCPYFGNYGLKFELPPIYVQFMARAQGIDEKRSTMNLHFLSSSVFKKIITTKSL